MISNNWFKNVLRSNFSIWLKLDRQILELANTIYVCFCYINPYMNKDDSELIFTQIENILEDFQVSLILKFQQIQQYQTYLHN
jgi:hypothetical protein